MEQAFVAYHMMFKEIKKKLRNSHRNISEKNRNSDQRN
jgi:hypothetical protein